MIQSAAIVDKDGKIYVASQYCEMTKSKVEALYLAFSRLIPKGKQHSYIVTEGVRYLFQAVNDFYCVLISDKSSNILEDIKTLRIFVGAINEYASSGKGLINAEDITRNRFELLFAFKEIVFMGMRQIDDLAQLRTVMAMDSVEEKAHYESLTKKEREAKAKAAEKSKELDQQRRNEMLHHLEKSMNRATPTGISSESKITEPIVEVEHKPSKPARVKSRGRALKLTAPKN